MNDEIVNKLVSVYILLSNIAIGIGSIIVFIDNYDIIKDDKDCQKIFYSSLAVGVCSILVVIVFLGFMFYECLMSLCTKNVSINFTLIGLIILAGIIIANGSSVYIWFSIGDECREHYKNEYSEVWKLFLCQMINVFISGVLLCYRFICYHKKNRTSEYDSI